MHAELRSENTKLRQQLDALLHEARQNEEKMRRFDRLERRLIGARTLFELVGLILEDFRGVFAIESVSLALIDPDGEIARSLVDPESGRDEYPGLIMLRDDKPVNYLFHDDFSVFIGPCTPNQAELFAHDQTEIASLALLPLLRQGRPMGSLHLGSSDASRYPAGIGTDFLERLANIIAICLENTLAQERLKRAGLTDGLTGVQNRRHFDHRCQVEVAQALRHGQPLACMFVDIDRFKRINDTYGHQTGDSVLRSVARLIQGQVRAADTVARYGGEEFVVLLPQTPGFHARETAERIRRTVENTPFRAGSEELSVSISIGLSMLCSQHSESPDSSPGEAMVASADRALYQAKHGGRNRVVAVGIPDPLPPSLQNRTLSLLRSPLRLFANLLGQARN